MTLLPSNSTTFERAIEISLHRVGGIDVDALKRMRDPWGCSVSHLPFLAWGRGVDLWYEDWPEHRKRRITADIYRMKGLKGTLPGANAYLAYVDAKVIEAVLPPQAVVARADDPKRLKRFRERFAEIRLYPFATRARRSGTVASLAGSPTAIVGKAVSHGRDLRAFYGRRAVLRDRGVETTIRAFESIRSVSGVAVPSTSFVIPSKPNARDSIEGRAVVGRMVAGRTRGGLITIGAGAFAATIPAGFEGVNVLNVSPERVYERHGALSDQPVAIDHPRTRVGRMVARHGVSDLAIYDRWYLFDRERSSADPYQTLGPVVGKMVPELSPHHAFLRVDARFGMRGRSARVDRAVAGRVVAKVRGDRIDRIGAAIYRSKALHDTVRFTTRTHRPLGVGDLSFERSVPFTGMVPI